MELGTALVTVGLGAPTIIGIIIGVFKWSLGRNVAHEDEHKKRTDAALGEHDKELRELRETVIPNIRTTLDNELKVLRESEAKRDSVISELRGTLSGLGNSLGELRGSIAQLGGQLETGREKQALAHREAMKELETSMRQELSRHAHPELPEKVAKLEVAIATLAPPRRKR